MRSEKYIRDNLNKALSEEAPDILSSILKNERIEDNLENDLREEALFNIEKENNIKWISRAIVTCAIALLLIVTTISRPNLNNQSTQKLCTITIDVNPSLDIRIDSEGNVVKVVANNEDAKEIAKKANKKIDKKNSGKIVINYIAKQLVKSGYLNKNSSVMLISVPEEEKSNGERLDDVRKIITSYKDDNNKKFVTVYQKYENSKEVKELAEEKGMSNAKAAYCLEISRQTNKKIDDICDKSLDEVTRQIMREDIDLGDKIDIEINSDEDKEEKETKEKENSNEENKDETQIVEDVSGIVEKEMSSEHKEKTTEIETMEETINIEEPITEVEVGGFISYEEDPLQEPVSNENLEEFENNNESEIVIGYNEEITSGTKMTDVASEERTSELSIEETMTGTDNQSEISSETKVHKEDKVIITETTNAQ